MAKEVETWYWSYRKREICMSYTDAIKMLNEQFDFADDSQLPMDLSYDRLVEKIASIVDQLVSKDPERFIWTLYRMDVSEPKVKAALGDHAIDDSCKVVAELIIERQIQRVKTREFYKDAFKDAGEDEERL